MWDALKNLYEAKNENRKMAFKDKLHYTKMSKGESVSSYLTRVAQVKDDGADCGTISLRRRSKKDLRAVDRRQMELMKRMLLLLQRARGRRKEIPGGT
jgi:hypothetical protein